jgi:hypothetical protein
LEEEEMPNKSKVEVKKFIEALEESGYEPESYSGRGMYGKECVSISGDVSAWDVARALWFCNFDSDDLDIPEPKQDQLGLGIVLYWPSYEWPKEEV